LVVLHHAVGVARTTAQAVRAAPGPLDDDGVVPADAFGDLAIEHVQELRIRPQQLRPRRRRRGTENRAGEGRVAEERVRRPLMWGAFQRRLTQLLDLSPAL